MAAAGEAVHTLVEVGEPVLIVVCKAVAVVLVVVSPTAFGDRWRASRWWRWRGREQEQAAADRSLELLVADLRRLEREFRRTEQDTDVAYRTARLQAISLAYDDTLLLCCRLLDVPEPERPPWNPVTRLQIEAELARAGLDW
jgi:hypothetical protein